MAHIHEKIDFTTDVFVVHGDRVLMRKHEKYHIWLGVGGHIELNEDPIEAAVREVKEEVGLDVRIIDTRMYTGTEEERAELIPPMGMNRHRVSDTHEHISLYYAALCDSDEVIPENVDDEWKWCKSEELEELEGILPGIVFYAREALRLAGEKRN